MIRVATQDMFADMLEKHDRLRKSREDAGFGSASAAANALSMTASTYRAHENGQNDFDFDFATKYAKRFGVDPMWLFAGIDKPTDDTNVARVLRPVLDSPNARVLDKISGLGRKIPVYGQAVGGVDGEFEMNGNILYEVMAPPSISHIQGAYAVQVAGESMYPRYDDGEVAFIDPKRRLKKGDYIVAQIQLEENGPLLAYVKKFIRHNAVELVLEQFNPPKELRFPSECVRTVHFIALAGVA